MADSKKSSLSINAWGEQTLWKVEGHCQVSTLSQQLNQLLGSLTLNVLRVSISFEQTQELALSLEQLSSFLEDRKPGLCLLQVKYKFHTLIPENRKIHAEFDRKHSVVSTYMPLCLPPSPLGELVQWTTPQNCSNCLFHETKKCGGLTGEEAQLSDSRYLEASAGGALATSWQWPLKKEEFQEHPSVCYWWPEPTIQEQLIKYLGPLLPRIVWDIGGGNGFLAWLLKKLIPSIEYAYCIDPVAHVYPELPELKSLSITAEEGYQMAEEGNLFHPDMLIISWPTTGKSYRQLIEDCQPQLILRASDQEKVCGVRRGQKALMIEQDQATLYALAEAEVRPTSIHSSQGLIDEYDDFDTPLGYQRLFESSVWHYRDFQMGNSQPTGQLVIFKRDT